MAVNDIYLRQVPASGDNTNDIRLYDPTVADGTGPTDYPLTATSSAIVLSGSSVVLKFGRNLLATSSTLALAASSVTIRKGYSLGATSSAITLSGSSVALQFGRKISATSSAITLAPSNVTLAFGHKINATSSTVVLASPNVTLATGRKINATSGAVVLSGSNVTLTYAPAVGVYEIIATSSAIVLAPSTVELIYVPAVIVDFFDTHDGISRAKPQETYQERLRKQKYDLADIIARRMRGDEPQDGLAPTDGQQPPTPRKPLPESLTRLLRESLPAQRVDIENEAFVFPLNVAAIIENYRTVEAELQRLEDDELAMVFLLCA